MTFFEFQNLTLQIGKNFASTNEAYQFWTSRKLVNYSANLGNVLKFFPKSEMGLKYSTFNPLDKTSGMVLTNNNRTITYTTVNNIRGDVYKNSGVWYYEMSVSQAFNVFNGSAHNFGIWPINRDINTYSFMTVATARLVYPYNPLPIYGVVIDFNLQKIFAFVDLLYLGEITFSFGGELCAIFFGEDNLGTSQITLNAGQSPFTFPDRLATYGANPGFYDIL